MIIDGKAIADRILTETRLAASSLPHVPSFAAFAVAPSPATQSYLRMKARQAERAGIQMEVRELRDDIDTDALIGAIQTASEDAVIVQLPLPEHINTMRVLEAIPEDKDADVLSPAVRTHGSVLHPIAASIEQIFKEGNVTVAGSRAVVVGQGWLVGQPATAWLTQQGAQVTTVTRESGDLLAMLPLADIIVSGAGSPGLIMPDLVKEGAAVIDVGTSELGGSIAGDVAPEVRDVAGLFTPVPGGVGPVAVAFLMKNVVQLARLRNAHNGVH